MFVFSFGVPDYGFSFLVFASGIIYVSSTLCFDSGYMLVSVFEASFAGDTTPSWPVWSRWTVMRFFGSDMYKAGIAGVTVVACPLCATTGTVWLMTFCTSSMAVDVLCSCRDVSCEVGSAFSQGCPPPLGRRRGGGDAGSLLQGVLPPEFDAFVVWHGHRRHMYTRSEPPPPPPKPRPAPPRSSLPPPHTHLPTYTHTPPPPPPT